MLLDRLLTFANKLCRIMEQPCRAATLYVLGDLAGNFVEALGLNVEIPSALARFVEKERQQTLSKQTPGYLMAGLGDVAKRILTNQGNFNVVA